MLYSPELFSTVQELILAIRRGNSELVESGKQRLQLLGIKQPEIEEIIAEEQFLESLAATDDRQQATARERLRKLGIADAEIDELTRTKRAPSGLTIRSPDVGHVIAKNVVQGDRVDPGTTLFEIADLTQVWVEADVFEQDISLLDVGQRVQITAEALPNQSIEGKIILVHPHLETATRTDRIRIELPNPGHKLRPGMYATVKISIPFAELEPFKSQSETSQHEATLPTSKNPNNGKPLDDAALIALQKTCPITGADLGTMGKPIKRVVGDRVVFLCCPACIEEFEKTKDKYLAEHSPPPTASQAGKVLVVPEAAVIDTGTRKIVYVEDKPGQFDGISVELGPESNGFYPVVKGLKVGQRVAAAGAFLVDAETRLNPAAGSTYIGAGSSPQSDRGKASAE